MEFYPLVLNKRRKRMVRELNYITELADALADGKFFTVTSLIDHLEEIRDVADRWIKVYSSETFTCAFSEKEYEDYLKESGFTNEEFVAKFSR